ncbi:MAG: sulfite exporter TauE/SafE family protein [Mariprofundaceae bacterium]|nr:sulfite exporter TauE/SafE family protein [Mariprofundaceae bacterium]
MSEFDGMQLLLGLTAGTVGGALGGVLAGIAGVGGGLIYVPVFYALLSQNPDAIPLSVFISLLAIVVTGGFSARAHARLGHINRHAVGYLLPGLICGAVAGLMFTLRLPGTFALAALALLDGWVAYDYGKDMKSTMRSSDSPRLPWVAVPPIGFISGTLGIGGGTMLVPLLRRSLPLRQAIGTSALCGTLMAAAALAINGIFIPDWKVLLGSQIWFILGVLAAILCTLPFSTSWSAGLHASLSEGTMRMLLKGVFSLLSAGLGLAALFRFLQ